MLFTWPIYCPVGVNLVTVTDWFRGFGFRLKRHAVRPLLFTVSHLVLSACPLVAPPRLQPAEEVRARRAEGQAAHPQTLRARPHGGSQEGRADQTSGSIQRFTLPKHYAYFVLSERSWCSFICISACDRCWPTCASSRSAWTSLWDFSTRCPAWPTTSRTKLVSLLFWLLKMNPSLFAVFWTKNPIKSKHWRWTIRDFKTSRIQSNNYRS